MRESEFITYLQSNPDTYKFHTGDQEGKAGVFVFNKRFSTWTHFCTESLANNSLNALLSQTAHGKDVDHITRITGYFTRVSSWNKGKRGELHDRYRSQVN